MPWLLIIQIVIAVLSYLLRPKPQDPAIPVPGELEATVVDSSSDVPVLFGTRIMKSTNCVWYGDVGTTPIITCAGGKK
jgi:hypothetical protein